MSAKEIIDKYTGFFEDSPRNHKRIPNSPLVPQDDPTTLFTSSGMQPLIPYLLGEPHPAGRRLVDVQNCFRAVDIEEVGDNRHTTFFRMLGNWSLGDYFKEEEIPWLWEFLTKELGLPKEKLFITVFKGSEEVSKDRDSYEIWSEIVPQSRIFWAGVDKNWWSRSGIPEKMPIGEIGGPDTEVYYRFDDVEHKPECKDNPVDCECGKFLEIANSVFIQYQKTEDGFKELPQRNVDHGAGVERLLAAVENKSDMFETSLFAPIIKTIKNEANSEFKIQDSEVRIAADHLIASIFISASGIRPSKTQQGYILRRLIRRALDSLHNFKIQSVEPILETIVEQYKDTDPDLLEKYEEIKNLILEEQESYKKTIDVAIKVLDQAKGDDSTTTAKRVSANDAFNLYQTHGLSPTQIKSLGYIFDEQGFAELMEKHQLKSKTASAGMFKGGLADHSELTVKGHTATHLLHQALRDVFGSQLHQTGSNITSERVRFDFNFDRALAPEEIQKVEGIVKDKIKENLPVHFEMMPLEKAKEIGAIGLFDEKYQENVKIYFIGDYSKEFCGGPHVEFTGSIKSFKIIKQENLGRGQRRLYSSVS